MKRKSTFWFSLLLIPYCIFGQQKVHLTPSWVYENGVFLELQKSAFNWDNPDHSTLNHPFQQAVDWNELISTQNSLLRTMWMRMDSLQQQQNWQKEVYDQQIQQIELQVEELQKLLITLQQIGNGPKLATMEKHIMLDYNIPTEISIYFTHQNASIEIEALMALNEVIELLSRESNSAVLLSGFANDYLESKENILLSQRRVSEISNMLMSAGISPDRIITRYMGHCIDDGKLNYQKVTITFIEKP